MDYVYVDEDKIEEDLLCMVCSRPFVEPTEHINCGKEFCRSCIEKVASCPNCRSEVNGHTRAITLKRLLNPLNDLKVICPRCDGQFTRGDLAMHLLKCVKDCPNGCGKQFSPKELTMHEAVCGLKKVPCPAYGLCSWNGTPAELKVHTITCTFIPLLKKLHDQEALCQTLLATVETLQQRIAALEGQKFLDQEASGEESEEEDQRKVPTKKKILTYLKESKNKSKKGSKGSDTEGSPKRSRKGFKEKDPNAPKKNQSSYLFFYNDMREDIKKANPNAKITEIATVLGAQWKAMSASEKKNYEVLAQRDKERYEKDKKNYMPSRGKSKGSKKSAKKKAESGSSSGESSEEDE